MLSVIVMTFNEEKNIGRCLDSVKGVADEILVVDSYSTDRTEEICREHGARFIQHTFFGYIEQRNWSCTQSKYPHVLFLDADEELSKKLTSSICKAKADWKADGYTFNRLNNYCGKWIRHTTWYPSRKLRLWNTSKAYVRGINPHDRVEMDPGSKVKHLRGDLLHYSYYHIDEHKAQLERFASLRAQAYFKMGKKTTILELIAHTSWRFLNDYIVRLGFLDGRYGFIVSKLGAKEVMLKYKRLMFLWKEYKANMKRR